MTLPHFRKTYRETIELSGEPFLNPVSRTKLPERSEDLAAVPPICPVRQSGFRNLSIFSSRASSTKQLDEERSVAACPPLTIAIIWP